MFLLVHYKGMKMVMQSNYANVCCNKQKMKF